MSNQTDLEKAKIAYLKEIWLSLEKIVAAIESIKKKNDDKPRWDGWRSDPATETQKSYLFKYQVACSDNITKGEASDLIDWIKEGQQRFKTG